MTINLRQYYGDEEPPGWPGNVLVVCAVLALIGVVALVWFGARP